MLDFVLVILTIHTHSYTEKTLKGYEETFGGNGHVYYLDCDNDFTGVCINPNSSDCVI